MKNNVKPFAEQIYANVESRENKSLLQMINFTKNAPAYPWETDIIPPKNMDEAEIRINYQMSISGSQEASGEYRSVEEFMEDLFHSSFRNFRRTAKSAIMEKHGLKPTKKDEKTLEGARRPRWRSLKIKQLPRVGDRTDWRISGTIVSYFEKTNTAD